MDPDMVRQQEEEEAASFLRGAVSGRTPFPPPKDDAFVLRAEPREVRKAPGPAADRPKRSPGWGAAVQATAYCLLFTIPGLVGGIMLGVKLGLVAWQSLAIGMIAGFLFGWRSAVAALRKRYATGFARAYRASLVPAIIILLSLVGGLAVILPFAGASFESAETGLWKPWLISLSIGAIAGFVFALPKMHGNLRG